MQANTGCCAPLCWVRTEEGCEDDMFDVEISTCMELEAGLLLIIDGVESQLLVDSDLVLRRNIT